MSTTDPAAVANGSITTTANSTINSTQGITPVKFLIPSYHRADKLTTLTYLTEVLHLPKEQIVIHTQTEADYTQYQKLHGDKAVIIYTEQSNKAGALNALLATVPTGDRFLLLDDDIRTFQSYTVEQGKYKPYPLQEQDTFLRLLNRAFDEVKQLDDFVFTCQQSCSNFAIKAAERWGGFRPGSFFTGQFIAGWKVESLPLFREDFDLLEDVAFTVDCIHAGSKALRCNYLFVTAARTRLNTGGNDKFYQARKEEEYAKLLLKEAPFFIKPAKRGSKELITPSVTYRRDHYRALWEERQLTKSTI